MTPSIDITPTYTLTIREELDPLLEAHGFGWIGPDRYRMLYGKTGGEYLRRFDGGWQSVDLVVRPRGSGGVEFNICISARLDAFDEMWMEQVLRRPDDIDQTAATVRVHLGTYLYQWTIPTAENYPAPPRTAERAQRHDVAFYASTVEEARHLVRHYVQVPLEQTMLPLILRCESAAGFVDVGRRNRYFTPAHRGHEYLLAHLAQDEAAMSALVQAQALEPDESMARALAALG